MSLVGILENIAADILFVILGLIVGWVALKLLGRDRLLRFFGVSSAKRVTIYVSNLRVRPFGAIGISGDGRSYSGSTAAFLEIEAAIRLRDTFNYLLPSVTEKPTLLEKLLISDTIVQIAHSPLQKSQLELASPLIALGSPAYNLAARYIEDELHSQVKFQLGTKAAPPSSPTPYISGPVAHSTQSEVYTGGTVASMAASPAGQSSPGTPEIPPALIVENLAPITDTTYGFVERVFDTRNSRNVFYVAGLSEMATSRAAQFLALEWRQLANKFGDRAPFLVMLRFEPADLSKWAIVFEHR